ncbi:hypothetical protein NSP_26600 [Nodularia spumigena CCY9414]|nr:hypothetical protein NSP_26600 [Nodularia spumigena CCY9414]EAW47272.1 hypothetical protein N9414_20800 [Nodularia spumigena CCY9414]
MQSREAVENQNQHSPHLYHADLFKANVFGIKPIKKPGQAGYRFAVFN